MSVFFCQIEALETVIFLGEVAGRTRPWIENQLREDNQAKNAGLYRSACKLATAAGKRVVIACLGDRADEIRMDRSLVWLTCPLTLTSALMTYPGPPWTRPVLSAWAVSRRRP